MDVWGHNFRFDSSFALCVVTMFLGGSYHDRDNPHKWGVSHGQLIAFITLVCSQKEGTDSRGAAAGDTFELPWMKMMKMMLMTIFYAGIGTKCTEHQIIVKRNKDRNDDDDDGNLSATGNSGGNNTNTNTTSNNNKNNKSQPEDRSMMTMRREAITPVARLDQPDLLPTMMGMMAMADGHNQRKPRLDGINQWSQPKESTDGEINRSWNRTMEPTAPGSERTTPRRRQMVATDRRNAWLQQQMETTTGRMTMMWMTEEETKVLSATGTLDRKTSQASPKACLYNTQHKTTREA
jgi:hypothetical protein